MKSSLNEYIQTIKLEVVIQENGIIRDSKGTLIGRMTNDSVTSPSDYSETDVFRFKKLTKHCEENGLDVTYSNL